MPISSRFAPVMFASASEHGDAVPLAARDTPRRTPHGRAALPREHEVDRVLGQHRDQREDREREAGRDVEPRDLGRPRQQERRADDREPEQQGLEGVRDVGAGPAGATAGRDRAARAIERGASETDVGARDGAGRARSSLRVGRRGRHPVAAP